MAPKRRGNFKDLGDNRTRDELRKECTKRKLGQCYKYHKANLKQLVDNDERKKANVPLNKSPSKKNKQALQRSKTFKQSEVYHTAQPLFDNPEDSETFHTGLLKHSNTPEDSETFFSGPLVISGDLEELAMRDSTTSTSVPYRSKKLDNDDHISGQLAEQMIDLISTEDIGLKRVLIDENVYFFLFDLQRTKSKVLFLSFTDLLKKYFDKLYFDCKKNSEKKDFDTNRFFCCFIEQQKTLTKQFRLIFSLSISYELIRNELHLFVNNTCKHSDYMGRNLLKEAIELGIKYNASINSNKEIIYAKLYTSNSHFCSALLDFHEANFRIHSVENGDVIVLKYSQENDNTELHIDKKLFLKKTKDQLRKECMKMGISDCYKCTEFQLKELTDPEVRELVYERKKHSDSVSLIDILRHIKEYKIKNKISNSTTEKILQLLLKPDYSIKMNHYEDLTFVFFDLTKPSTKRIFSDFISLLEENFEKLYRDCEMDPNTIREFEKNNINNSDNMFFCIFQNMNACMSREICTTNLIFSLTMNIYDNLRGQHYINIENECTHPTYISPHRFFILTYAIGYFISMSPFIKKNKQNMFKIMNTSHPHFAIDMCNFLRANFILYKLVDGELYMRFNA